MSEQQQEKESKPTSFTGKVLITAGIVIPVILVLLLFGFAFKVLLLVMAAVLLSAFFRGIASWISRHTSIPMGWSLLIAVVGVLGIVVLTNLLIAPQIAEQASQLAEKLPQTLANAKQQLEKTQWGKQLINQIPEDPLKFLENRDGWFQKTFGVVSSTLGTLADLYIILLLGMFILADPQPYVKGIVSLVPPSRHKRAQEVLDQVYTTLQRWLAGKLLSMLVVAVLTVIGLWILGVPLALVLGLIAGLFSFIPNFGPILGLIPAVLVALLESPTTALYVVLLYVGIQAVESNLITPFIQREAVSLPLAMIIIAQILLGILVGGLGLILATPILAVVVVLIRMLYVEDVLGDKAE